MVIISSINSDPNNCLANVIKAMTFLRLLVEKGSDSPS